MITVEETRDKEVVMSLLDDEVREKAPPIDAWFDFPSFTYLVAKENGEPRLLALLVDGGTETQNPEIHLSATRPWMHITIGCRMMKEWIKQNRDWPQIWSFTRSDNPTTLELAKHLGFDHAFDDENRRFIVLNLNN